MRSLFNRLFGPATAPQSAAYEAVVDWARTPGHYTALGVPDTVDGRFDMVCLGLALLLIRLEADGAASAAPRGALLERFIDDMDRSIRELGVGDLSVGKEVKAMLGALTGRMDAYRAGLDAADPQELADALTRNVWRAGPAGDVEGLATVARAVAGWTRTQDSAALAAHGLAGAPRP